MTTATLGLAVDSSSVVSATPALDKMTAASMRAEGAAEQLAQASRGSSAGMQQLSGAVKTATTGVSALAARSVEAGRAIERMSATSVAGFQRVSASIDGMRYQSAGIAAQFQDVGVTAAMGMSPLMIGLQQGTQLAGQLAAMDNPIKGLGAAFGSLLSPVSLLAIGFTTLLAVGIQWGASLLGASNDADRALANTAMSLDQVNSAISSLTDITDGYARAILDTSDSQSAATRSILANSEKEFNAKKSLLDLELKRQQALIATQQLELAQSQTRLGQDVRGKLPTAALGMGEAGGYSDPLIGDFVRSPAQANLLESTQQLIDSNPLTDKIKELKANLELTEVAAAGIEEALKLTFSDGVAESVAKIGESTKKAADELNVFDVMLRDVGHLLNEAGDPFTTLQSNMDTLGALLAAGEISWQQYGEAVARANRLAASGVLDSVAQITGTLAQAFEGNKAIAAANIVVSTAAGAMKAYEQGGLLGFAGAAAIVAAGAVQLQSVLSAKPGSASVAGGGGNAPATTAAAPQSGAGQGIIINLHGGPGATMSNSDLLTQLQEQAKMNGQQIVVRPVNGTY